MRKTKIGIVCICLNESYWQYALEMLWGLKTFFLKHHSVKDKYETDLLLWSDMPEPNDEKFWDDFKKRHDEAGVKSEEYERISKETKQYLEQVRKEVKVFPMEPMEWPMPTLMRYHLFLQQEEELQKYDYIFYIDVDMRITDWIGEEILGDGLTAAEHPMYSLRPNYYPPYEPNEKSTAYINRPGKVVTDESGKVRFKPYYYAGGFQGGKTDDFIKAMKVMRKNIDEDLANNYVAIWNDESHWNKYLFETPPSIVLNPSYIYPDSLVGNANGQDYYIRLWGRNYSPKIMTLTKAFTASKEGGDAVRQLIAL